MKNKLLLLIAGLFVVLFSAFTSDKTITIFMIGDSTMANKPLEGDNQERGWGQVLGGFFSEEIVIDNHGNAVLASGAQLYPFEGGETVLNASDTAQVLKPRLPAVHLLLHFSHPPDNRPVGS